MDKTNANCAKGRCSRSRVSVACQTDVDPAAVGACDHTAFDSSSASGKTATSQRRAVFGNVSANTQNGVEPTTSCQRPHNNQAASPARAAEEGTLRVTIQNFSKMSDTLCSPSKRINNVPWRIMVMPKQHMVMKKSQKCMGFFLQCCPDNTYNDQWACQAVAEMRLISQKMGVQNFVRKTTHSYTAKENDWGYSCFMTWADVLDENQGYIKEDKVVLEIHVKAESPKNMMSKQDFLQKLEQWYKLADIHRAKNSVDLAIEANQQAIAYCKDKDKEMLAKLKAQKDVLVKQKLMDSIKRLEAGDKTPTKEEEQPGKMSVRAAINGGGAAKAAGTVKRVQNTAANMKKNHVHAKQTGKTGALKKDEKEKVAKKLLQGAALHEFLRDSDERYTRSLLWDLRHMADEPIEEGEEELIQEELQRLIDARDNELRAPSSTASRTRGGVIVKKSASKRADSRLLPSATPDQQLSEAESGDDDFLKTNEFREDLDCSLDTCDSVNTLDSNGKCSSDCALQKRDIDGSDSSLDLETQSSDNCVPVNESVEMNDSECQTEQSLLCSTPFRGILTQTTCGMSSAQHLQPTQAQQGQQQQQTAPLAVLASEALTRSHPVGAVPVAQHRAAAVSQVAVGTTGTRVGGINARVSSILQMPPQVGVKMEEKHRQQLKHVAAFFDEKNGVEVTKQLASLFTEHSVDGTQECVAVVIASHLATLHCNKVMKAMEEFLNGAEGLFKTESVVASLKVLKQNAASICQRAEEERRKKLAAKRIVKNAPREEKEASPPADVEINLTDSESEDADYSDETEADGEEEEDDEEDVAIAVECEDDMKRLRAIQQQPTNEAMEAIRNFALRELYQFNQNMGRAMERLTQLNDAIHVISATLPDFDPKKIVSEMCNHGDLKARVEELERSLAAEQTTHVAAKKVLTECQTHCQDLKNRTEQQNKLMREKTNELKRLEKKSTRDDNRIEELVREKTDLEERVKNMKRDLDALKKKHSEESRNLKNEKDKATKLVTRMEHEATEREHDREKERAALESRVRQLQSELDARTKEVKAAEQREKKAHAHATHAVQQMQERLRMQEVQTLEMQLAGVCGVFERVKQDAENEVEALEEHIKQCRSVASGSNDNDFLERLERSVLDWKTYVQNSSQNIATLKNEYLPQIESVRKGQKEWNQVQIKSTGPGRLPVILRPQVAPLPPTPGVIGQPRTPQPNSNGFSSPGGQPGFSRAPSPPAEGKRIAPIGARPTATVAPQTVDPLDGQDFGASCLTSLRLGGGIDQWSTWQSPLGGVGLGSIGGSSPSVSLGAPSSTPSSAVSDLSTVLPSRPLFSETPMREWEGAARQLGGGPPGGAPSLPGYPQWATHAHHNSHQQIHHHHGTPNSAGAPPGWPHQAPPPGTPRGHPFKPYMP